MLARPSVFGVVFSVIFPLLSASSRGLADGTLNQSFISKPVDAHRVAQYRSARLLSGIIQVICGDMGLVPRVGGIMSPLCSYSVGIPNLFLVDY